MSVPLITKRIEDILSASKNGLVTTNYDQDATVRGQGFCATENITIASSGSAYILITYNNDITFVMPPQFSTTAGHVLVNVYRGTNYTAGTSLNIAKKNTLTKQNPLTTYTQGATGSDKGTLALEYLVGSDASNQNSGGNSVSFGTFFVRQKDEKTLVEIVNVAGKEIIFNYSQDFYEI